MDDGEKQLRNAKKTINHLKNQLNMTNTKLRRVLLQFSKKKSLAIAEVQLNTSVKQIFSPVQIRKLESKKNVKWSSTDIINSLALASMSKKAYETVRCIWKIPLPSPSTLRLWTSNFQTSPGILKDVMKIMTQENKLLTAQQKLCIINFDEMSVNSNIVWDKSQDMVIGPHSKAQVVVANGICHKWRQPIFYAFDQKVTKLLLFELILF